MQTWHERQRNGAIIFLILLAAAYCSEPERSPRAQRMDRQDIGALIYSAQLASPFIQLGQPLVLLADWPGEQVSVALSFGANQGGMIVSRRNLGSVLVGQYREIQIDLPALYPGQYILRLDWRLPQGNQSSALPFTVVAPVAPAAAPAPQMQQPTMQAEPQIEQHEPVLSDPQGKSIYSLTSKPR